LPPQLSHYFTILQHTPVHDTKNDACSGFVNESPSMYVVGQNTTLTLPLLILDVIKISNIQLMRLFAI